MQLAWAGQTHAGKVRQRNEDAVLVAAPIFAVADGMGGHADGNVASALTIETLETLVGTQTLSRTDILDAIRAADLAIAEQASGKDDGMGTTVTGLAVLGANAGEPKLLVFNVGDSRSYRLRNNALVQLTHDHSVVQELLDAGSITAEEATRHPERNVITRSLGGSSHLEIDWALTEPKTGDRFLVCSDGLSRELGATQIAELLAQHPEPEAAADALVAAALDAGGHDNISVVVLDVLEHETSLPDDRADRDALEADTEPKGGGLKVDTSETLSFVATPPVEGVS